ncbi:helix-turn-helix domain-containing protein [Evansella sp. LMS18]|uniref:helix-turn-helix domain-containing protein n=1 Tax=Evansella sp. LMS18 TaxID=2924033 RepID=UPI0020D1AFF7|nr:helix-turn-helix domain-containing protein [Evansella sp. LMS18]UTR10209.1 helix-turn-helix domain-containing protein [Evansella sp. LMS18]
MPHYQRMTLEELEAMESSVLDKLDSEEDWGSFGDVIRFYEAYYGRALNRAKKTRDEFDRASESYIKEKLIRYLVEYGTYMKMIYQKSDKHAEEALIKAVALNPALPIAYYRLGFLAYKKKDYKTAALRFQQTLDDQGRARDNKWQLNDRQLYHAHLYLVNSSLFVAKETNERLKEFPEGEYEKLAYDISPLYEWIDENEAKLQRNAFVKRTNEGSEYCSREECDYIYERADLKDCLILYNSDRSYLIRFNNQRRNDVTADRARMLRHFLLNSSRENPLKKSDLIEHFQTTEVSNNAFVQKISRLRKQLNNIDIPEIIETAPQDTEMIRQGVRTETAYFYNGRFPFIIMERVGDELY